MKAIAKKGAQRAMRKLKRAVHQKHQAMVVRTPMLPEHRYDLNADQVSLIKRTIAKGATDDELQLFLWVAKRHRLDPFTRQLHLVRRFDRNLDNGEGNPKGGHVATIQIGIDGYRQMASRYPDFGSVSEAEYEMPTGGDKVTSRYPVWAKVKVFKKGISEPSVGVAFWDEYAPDLTQPAAFMWKKMPKHMLAKCAEAIALRKAYPDLADIYTDDEMARTNAEHTESGRMMQTIKPPLTRAELVENFDQRMAQELARMPEDEREGFVMAQPKAEQENIRKRLADIKGLQPAAQPTAKGGEAAAKTDPPASPTVEMVSFPDKAEGDVTVRANDNTAVLLGLKRRSALPGCWLVKYDALPRFYDVARDKGVEVKEAP